MGFTIEYNLADYIYPHYFGKHKGTKGYRHHNICGLCGNQMHPTNGKEYVMQHIAEFHSEKLILLNDEGITNSKFTDLLNIQDQLEFDLFKLEVIESCLNGTYKGWSHPRFHHVRMNDSKQVIQYRLLKIKEDIMEYDFQMNTYIPILDYKEEEAIIETNEI